MALPRIEPQEDVPDCPPESVRKELARILDSPEFPATPQRRKLLEYLVEEMLAGRGSAIKGYTIGVNVLGRGEDFDPDADPAVRREARSLRRDLDSYYVDAGRGDPLRISIPKGHYVPTVTMQHSIAAEPEKPEPALETQRSFGRPLLVVLAFLTAVLGATYFLLHGGKDITTGSGQQGPVVVVQPFKSLGSDSQSMDFAAGLTADLINTLMQFPSFRLYSLQPDIKWLKIKDPSELGKELGVTYLVNGDVVMGANEIAVHTQLIDATTGAILWSKRDSQPVVPEMLISMQRHLAGEIAGEIGQPYGIVYSDLESRQKASNVNDMQSYICVLRAYDYRRSGFTSKKYTGVVQCLEAAVEREPDYADAWAMLGWLYMDGGRFDLADGDQKGQYEKALRTANRAIALSRDNVLAISAVSAIDHYLGHYDESIKLARRALKLNPNDSDIIAQLGWRLSVRGNFDEGVPLLERAIARTANPPAWYYHLVTISDFMKGDYERILERAKILPANSDLNQALIAMTNAELGNAEATRLALAKISPNGLVSRDFAGFIRRHGAADEIFDALVPALEKARKFASGQ